MRILVWSDLHVDVASERAPFIIPDRLPPRDVHIIAGDVREGPVDAIRWIVAGNLNEVPVIYVTGNHEWYRHKRDTDFEKAVAEAARHKNIHLLQDSHVDIDGVRFVGATLWTDYALYGEPYRWQCYTAAQSGMNDHRLIRVAKGGYRKWTTKDAWQEHCASRLYIEKMLAQPFDGKRVVVTHHAPSMKSIDHERHAGDILNAAFASDLEALVDKCDLWVHGHIHTRRDYRIGDGRVICNPRGYVGIGEKSGFDPELVVEV